MKKNQILEFLWGGGKWAESRSRLCRPLLFWLRRRPGRRPTRSWSGIWDLREIAVLPGRRSYWQSLRVLPIQVGMPARWSGRGLRVGPVGPSGSKLQLRVQLGAAGPGRSECQMKIEPFDSDVRTNLTFISSFTNFPQLYMPLCALRTSFRIRALLARLTLFESWQINRPSSHWVTRKGCRLRLGAISAPHTGMPVQTDDAVTAMHYFIPCTLMTAIAGMPQHAQSQCTPCCFINNFHVQKNRDDIRTGTGRTKFNLNIIVRLISFLLIWYQPEFLGCTLWEQKIRFKML